MAGGRQNWRTPRALHCGLVDLVGWGPEHPFADVAADEHNALGDRFIPEAAHGGHGALHADASWGPRAWCNPPYRRPLLWVTRAQAAARAEWTSTLFLLPAGLDTRWGRELALSATWWLTAGRVKFIDPDTGRPGSSPPSGHMVALMTSTSVLLADTAKLDRTAWGLIAQRNFAGFLDPATGAQL